MMKMIDPRGPLGLYLHIPFCKERCSYCDFLTFPHAEDLKAPYIEALCRELETFARRGFFKPYFVDTIYLGGGTPSILPAHLLEKLLTAIRKYVPFGPEGGPREWTLEANPGDLTGDKIESLREGGINRISLGLQTLNPSLLSLCNRFYGEEEICRDLEDLQKAGIRRVSFDYIYGLPGQTTEDIDKDLSFIKKTRPGHISWYGLILEEKTLLKYWIDKKKIVPLTEDQELFLMKRAFEGLENLGYRRYEISNFAFEGEESIHNLKYWSGEEYLGLGLGASSYIRKERFTETRNLHLYVKEAMEGKISWIREKRRAEDDLFEQVMMGLRKIQGMDFAGFEEKNGRSLLSYGGNFFKKAREEGLLDWNTERVWLSPRGLDLQNLFLTNFLIFLEGRNKTAPAFPREENL